MPCSKKELFTTPDPFKLVINGRIPSKKNSRCLFVRGGRIVNIPSKAYSEWHKSATLQLKSNPTPLLITQIGLLQLTFFAPDRRGTDLTNKAESIMDLLVDNKVLADDNWWVVGNINLRLGGVDKENPRCEILIDNYESV